MSSRLNVRRPLAGIAAALALVALSTVQAGAQAVPSWPGDSITARAAPAYPVYTATGPIAPTLPGDTLMGNALSADAAVPLHPIAPTMPGDVITRPPLWVLDSLHADSARQGLLIEPEADSLNMDDEPEEGIEVLPDQPERADSLRAEPESGPSAAHPRGSLEKRRPVRDDGAKRS